MYNNLYPTFVIIPLKVATCYKSPWYKDNPLYWHTRHIKTHTIRRNTFFNRCLVSSVALFAHPHNTSDHILGVVSWQGVIQCRCVQGNFANFIQKFISGFHVAWEGDHVAIPSDYLPNEGDNLIWVIPHAAQNIRLLPVWGPYSWYCE